MKGTKQKNEAKPKLTPQREAVFQVIQERDDHPTASDIFEAARRRLPSISYATVYNSLRYLKEAGLVLEINFGDSASRYDRETERHDHAICNDCGKLVDSISRKPPNSCRQRRENHNSSLSRYI